MKTLALLLLTILAPHAHAEPLLLAYGEIACGGNYQGEELKFEVVPTLSTASELLKAITAEETFTVYVELPLAPEKKGKGLRVIYGEVVKDSEWDKLKALRDPLNDKGLQELLSRLGSTKTMSIWMGWSESGYVHFEGSQRDSKFTFSCKKL